MEEEQVRVKEKQLNLGCLPRGGGQRKAASGLPSWIKGLSSSLSPHTELLSSLGLPYSGPIPLMFLSWFSGSPEQGLALLASLAPQLQSPRPPCRQWRQRQTELPSHPSDFSHPTASRLIKHLLQATIC